MASVSDLNELMTHLYGRLCAPGCLLIAVDGVHGAGKSTLAQTIGEKLGGRVISLDEGYLDKHTGAYRESIRYEVLQRDIERFKAEERVLVIEGICLLEVLDEVDVSPDVAIYLKRIDQHGFWVDAGICDRAQDA